MRQITSKEPYASALGVLWIVDDGSHHRGKAFVKRIEGPWPTLTLVHLPVHAGELNQVEIYHSIIQRKPLDSPNLAERRDGVDQQPSRDPPLALAA